MLAFFHRRTSNGERAILLFIFAGKLREFSPLADEQRCLSMQIFYTRMSSFQDLSIQEGNINKRSGTLALELSVLNNIEKDEKNERLENYRARFSSSLLFSFLNSNKVRRKDIE